MRVQSIRAQGHRCRIVHERLAIVVVLLRVVLSVPPILLAQEVRVQRSLLSRSAEKVMTVGQRIGSVHMRLCWVTLRELISFQVFFLQYTTESSFCGRKYATR